MTIALGKFVALFVLIVASLANAGEEPHWAFVPPKSIVEPAVLSRHVVRNPIDAFLLAKLEAKGSAFNQEAGKEVLLRRICFDLTGLPPTIAQREEFIADDKAGAYERLVDRLLASTAYGERWGRHWLDVAGYADSDGYLAADRLRPEAWRYRDYVIQAHNDDLPYDRFVTEQLAGDELSDWRRAGSLTPEMVRQLTATGFLRTALDPTYPGYTEPNEIHQVMADTMQIFGSAFLGLTVHCARCHDHKFDPISIREYYALRATLLPALDPDRWQPSGDRGIPLAPESETKQIKEFNAKIVARVSELTAARNQLLERGRKKLNNPKATEADLTSADPDAKAEFEKFKIAIAAEQSLTRKLVLLRGLSDLEGKAPVARVLQRGDYTKPGEVVEPATPAALSPNGNPLSIREGYKTSGRRLALAKWLTEPSNPLLARVQVNRMWAQHFGRGLVPTVANFGKSGSPPSHPELLDWLATEFIRQKWSMKAIHRLMVTSTAYRQASGVTPEKSNADPNSLLLSRWRPRRLEGEAVRDSVLAVSGRLNSEAFGPPSPVSAKGDGSVDTNDDAPGNRRSVYVMVRRSQHLTILDLFDTPMMEVNCPQRPVSTVPLQALALFNSPFSERNANALAERIMKDGGVDDATRVRFAFRLLYSRDPKSSEWDRVERFLRDVAADQKGQTSTEAQKAAWVQLALVLLNSNEFLHVP